MEMDDGARGETRQNSEEKDRDIAPRQSAVAAIKKHDGFRSHEREKSLSHMLQPALMHVIAQGCDGEARLRID